MSTQTAAREVARRPLRLPAEPAVLAAWVVAGLGAFGLAWLAGWATAGERREDPRVVPIAAAQPLAEPPALEPATPLPALRRDPVRRKPRPRRPAPERIVATPPPAPRVAPQPVARRPVRPPPPTPVVIVGKG